MLGIAYHSPMIVSVLIAREKFKPHTVILNNDQWTDKLIDFVNKPNDGRDKVLFVEGVDSLSKIVATKLDFNQIKAIIFDEPNRLKQVKNLTMIGAQLIDQSVWQTHNVLPDLLNNTLKTIDFGVSDVMHNTSIKAKPVSPINNLTETVQPENNVVEGITSNNTPTLNDEIVGALGDAKQSVKDKFTNSIINFLCGQIQFGDFNIAKKATLVQGVDHEKLETLAQKANSEYGDRMYAAVYVMVKYNYTAKEAADLVNADLVDLEYLNSVLPISSITGFAYSKLTVKPKMLKGMKLVKKES